MPLKSRHHPDDIMARYAGEGSREGAVEGRTQVTNPKTGDYVKHNDTPAAK